MAKTNQSLDFASFITKKPVDKKTDAPSTSKTEAEKKINKKTATPVVRPPKGNPQKNKEPNEQITPPVAIILEQEKKVETTEYAEKPFLDFFEKRFTTENSDLVAIDRTLKNKIALLCSTNRKTSQLTLVSNIIQEWFDKNDKEVNRQLKSIFK